MQTRWALAVAMVLVPGVASGEARRIELLHHAKSAVAVSSRVGNARDKPEHLVDGKLDTAWNSKSGDLVGAWIAFRVPKSAVVKRIRMTVGFTHQEGKDDWFSMNPRIKQVIVSREGEAKGSFVLDPGDSRLQTIDVSGDGGEWRIEVAAVLPGSKASWREVCVSELEVWGTIGEEEETEAADPPVGVGELPEDAACSVSEAIRGRFVGKGAEEIALRDCVIEERRSGPKDERRVERTHRGDLIVKGVAPFVGVVGWGDGYEASGGWSIVGALPLGNGRDGVVMLGTQSGMGQSAAELRIVGLGGGDVVELWKVEGNEIEPSLKADGVLTVEIRELANTGEPKMRTIRLRGSKGKVGVVK